MATSLAAGVDVRRSFAREAENARQPLRMRLATVRDAVNRGNSLVTAFNETGDFFPPLFRQFVAVGEKTGHSAEIFQRLAEHYEHQIQLRRTFLRSIAWPLVQLLIAIGVIGLLIWFMGWMRARGSNSDILGWGLYGTGGLVVYLTIVASIAAGIWFLVQAARRGALWWSPVQRFLMAVPSLGRALKALAIARFAWTLHLALDAGMEVRRSLQLAVDSSGNVLFRDAEERMLSSIAAGKSLHEALAKARLFPSEFLDAVAVGEESGRLVETLELLSRQLQEDARSALTVLTGLAGYAVWLLVAGMIIMMIFRLAGFYLNMINSVMPK